MRLVLVVLLACSVNVACANTQPETARGPATAPATQPAGGKLPHIQVDVQRRQVRVECQMLGVETPLEFFCVLSGTSEHESVLRTPAQPSHIHTALLMLGLEPGEPVKFSEAAQKWFPPHGPPLAISVEFERDGRAVSLPAHRLMRSLQDKRPQPPHPWIFAGSRVMPDGNYAADVTGYIVSVVNFDLSLIDIPDLASNANETLEWQLNPETAPPAGTRVTMVIEPMGKDAAAPAPAAATQRAAGEGGVTPANGIDVPTIKIARERIELDDQPMAEGMVVARLRQMHGQRPIKTVRVAAAPDADGAVVSRLLSAVKDMGIRVEASEGDRPRGTKTTGQGAAADGDEAQLAALRQRWQEAVAPHQKPLRDAAQAHYEVINQLRREQQRLIDEADRIQRLIDELERQYQEMTTPRPPEASGR